VRVFDMIRWCRAMTLSCAMAQMHLGIDRSWHGWGDERVLVSFVVTCLMTYGYMTMDDWSTGRGVRK
jgi:hypothetical protein